MRHDNVTNNNGDNTNKGRRNRCLFVFIFHFLVQTLVLFALWVAHDYPPIPTPTPPHPTPSLAVILCSASASSTWSDNDSHRLLGLRYHDVLERFDRVLTRSVPTAFSFGGNVLIDASEQSVVALGGFFLAAGCWCFAPVIRESGASPYIVFRKWTSSWLNTQCSLPQSLPLGLSPRLYLSSCCCCVAEWPSGNGPEANGVYEDRNDTHRTQSRQ